MGTTTSFGHVGHCVTDLERSRRFYVELFGFEALNEIEVPDTPSDRLLRVPAPVGLRAAYLRKDGFILELMEFRRPGNPPAAERVVNQPGLTHLSFSVDDVDAVTARVEELGGEVLADTHIGTAVFLRDPDGQLIELFPNSSRKWIYGQ
ncbi:MAG TPA: VOC family protein [Acidimicrobiales bacterium]|nr:VOC family protein [Acidimicrobiales bacterium]